MKKLSFIILALLFSALNSNAQSEQGILPPATGEFKTYTDWKKVEVVFESGEKATYEYRIALVNKKGLACHYDLQIKNTSAVKLKFRVNTHYYDKLVKGNFGDKFENQIKPEKTVSFLVLTQGCKADKDKKDQPDYERCTGCGLSYEITVIKD